VNFGGHPLRFEPDCLIDEIGEFSLGKWEFQKKTRRLVVGVSGQ